MLYNKDKRHNLCCVCCTIKTKGKMQDNPEKETITDKVQTENKRIKKIPLRARMFVPHVCSCVSSSLSDGPTTLPGESYRAYTLSRCMIQCNKRFQSGV